MKTTNSGEQMAKLSKPSKAVTFTLNDEVLAMLKELADLNSSSMSQEVRRLIRDEHERNEKRLGKHRLVHTESDR